MKPLFVVLADRAESSESGKINVFGAGISHLVLPELPAVGPNLSMIVNFVLEEQDLEQPHMVVARVTRREDGFALSGQPTEMPASYSRRRPDAGEFQSINVVVNFNGILFEKEGVHDLALEIDDEVVAAAPLVVRIGTPDTDPDPSS